MADEEGEITVQVQPEEKAAPDKDPVAELQAQYKEIQEQQQKDQEAREAAEARASSAETARAAAEQTARTAQTEVVDTRLVALDQAIEKAKSEADAATSEYSAALEAGDWAKAAGAQRKIARAEAMGLQEEMKKSAWENYSKNVEAARAAQQQQSGDLVENYINNVAQKTPNSANWLRSHRDWISDPKKNAKLTAAHWDAVAEGVTVDTPEYFAHVERKIGLNTKPKADNGSGEARRSPSAPVASVTPSAGGTSGGVAEVRLSKNEAASATDGTLVWNYDDPSGQKRFKKGDPIGLHEMARRKKAGMEAGLYEKTKYEA